MFEKEAEEIANNKLCSERICYHHCNFNSPKHHRCGEFHRIYECVKEGIELGYNKTNEWHYVESGDLPNDQRIVEVFTKDKDTFIAYIDSEGEEWYVGQYFRKVLSMNHVIAWRNFVYPELPKEIK